MSTLYKVLDVPEDASYDDIRKAYLRKAREVHPDKGKSTENEEFVRVSRAFEILGDKDKRKAYDAELMRLRAATTVAETPSGDVEIDEMSFSDGEETEKEFGGAIYRIQCRCGGWHRLREADVGESGSETLVPCDSCALVLTVHVP